MRLRLRPEWRPRPLASVLGFMDLKTGKRVTLVTMFALFNKVAGVYGLIAIFNGGSLAQVSMYAYSVAALAVFAWGLKVSTDEDPKRTLYFAHLFVADHLLNTIWTGFFAVVWWVYNPHDGKRIANSAAQEQMISAGGGKAMTDDERRVAAQLIWNKEKGTAAMFLAIGWLAKVYFALLIYSYAIHLRKGTYRSLPLSKARDDPTSFQSTSALAPPGTANEYELDEERGFPSPSPAPFNSKQRPNGTSGPSASGNGRNQNHTSASARILRDLEAPIESVLWDEDDEEMRNEGGSRLAPPRATSSATSDAESERGDISGAGATSSRTRASS
ncbi:DUF1753-domain-containing protein [Clavulina sp. PMI_390]|nr:DUF1753-domain-containing protein [Clavulina sp. PMI_390]